MEKFNSCLNYYLDYIAATILAIAVIIILVATFKFIGAEDTPVKTIKIEYHGVKTDSINELNKIEIQEINVLLDSIQTTSNKIQQRQLDLVKSKEKDNLFNKLYTATIAIILSIAGFFGFKSVSEIKQRAITDAKEQAKFIADKEFDEIFNKKYRASVLQEATEAVSGILKTEVGNLEDRIANLENNSTPIATEEEFGKRVDDNNNQKDIFEDE